jgi:hypothetical protein
MRRNIDSQKCSRNGEQTRYDYSEETKFLATDSKVWVRFSALPDFLRGNGPGTRSTQPR